MKIIFAGTPEFATAPLRALLEEPLAGPEPLAGQGPLAEQKPLANQKPLAEPNSSAAKAHQIVAVFTQPDRRSGRGKKTTPPPVKQLALEYDIPVYQPENLRDQAELIKKLDADVMVVVAYGMLLPQEILDTPSLGCINIHASLLPRWRGAAPIQRAIEAGDTETGVSIMKMQLGLDTGPVYKRLSCPISKSDTTSSVHDKLATLGSNGIVQTLSELALNRSLRAEPQDDSLANYAKKISKREAEINWHMSASEIHNRVRAFNPWPICQTHHVQSNDVPAGSTPTRLRISQTSIPDTLQQSTNSNISPGTIVAITSDAIVVACGVGQIELQVLQRDGSKALPYREFSNGYTLQVGEHFAQEA